VDDPWPPDTFPTGNPDRLVDGQDLVPQFVVFVRWQDLLGITGATLLMALIASFIPVRRLAQIDPVTVFKG